jgi:hypothetical protein
MPLSAHCSPRDAHTVAQLWPTTAPRYHCGAAVAVADAGAPCDKLNVGVVLALVVTVGMGLMLRVDDAIAVTVSVLVAVAVPETLAPFDRLLVGVYDACGQKHMGCQPLYAACWHDGDGP